MYILVHLCASSFSNEKLDTVKNHWHPVSSSDVFAKQKLAFKNWHGGQFLNLPRTAVVPNSSKFFDRKTYRWAVYTDVHCSTVRSCSTSQAKCAPRRALVLCSSDVFAQQKLAFKNWQGGQFLNLARMPLVPCSSDVSSIYNVRVVNWLASFPKASLLENVVSD